MRQPAPAARNTPAPATHTHTTKKAKKIHTRPASLPRSTLVSIARTAGANLLTASLVGLIPRGSDRDRDRDRERNRNRDSTRNTNHGATASDAAPATPPNTSPEEQRRILRLEQSIRTRALVDDMVNSLE
jgi:hypothetical protein